MKTARELRRERLNPELKTDWSVYVSIDENPNPTHVFVLKRGEIFEIMGLIQGYCLKANGLEKLNETCEKLGWKKFGVSDFE